MTGVPARISRTRVRYRPGADRPAGRPVPLQFRRHTGGADARARGASCAGSRSPPHARAAPARSARGGRGASGFAVWSVVRRLGAGEAAQADSHAAADGNRPDPQPARGRERIVVDGSEPVGTRRRHFASSWWPTRQMVEAGEGERGEADEAPAASGRLGFSDEADLPPRLWLRRSHQSANRVEHDLELPVVPAFQFIEPLRQRLVRCDHLPADGRKRAPPQRSSLPRAGCSARSRP